jgi:hypothetical protein
MSTKRIGMPDALDPPLSELTCTPDRSRAVRQPSRFDRPQPERSSPAQRPRSPGSPQQLVPPDLGVSSTGKGFAPPHRPQEFADASSLSFSETSGNSQRTSRKGTGPPLVTWCSLTLHSLDQVLRPVYLLYSLATIKQVDFCSKKRKLNSTNGRRMNLLCCSKSSPARAIYHSLNRFWSLRMTSLRIAGESSPNSRRISEVVAVIKRCNLSVAVTRKPVDAKSLRFTSNPKSESTKSGGIRLVINANTT